MQKLKILFRYIAYLQQAKSKFDIHSPFLFDLVTKVLEDSRIYPEYEKIENLKKNLLKSEQTINVVDLGAGTSSGDKNTRSISSITKNSSKPFKLGRLLYRLSKYYAPEHIIELGTSMGLSTAYMAMGNPAAKVVTIEGCPNISKVAGENFKLLGIKNITLINGNFNEALPSVLDSGKKVDLAFIDGNHLKEPTIKYFEQFLANAVNDTCLIFDDIHWSDQMQEAWNHITNHKEVSLSIDLFFMGLVFLKKELSKEHFILRF
ncbi:MAG: class I SAM-dependent methyltransferase [Bacteroidales bacterium]|nr:class I SAM-dependent methyltransferase [Bacteroidales bacterium]MCF8403075.1 class I SAM-dependent methyltransferase [Bacteroidales bacterium]